MLYVPCSAGGVESIPVYAGGRGQPPDGNSGCRNWPARSRATVQKCVLSCTLSVTRFSELGVRATASLKFAVAVLCLGVYVYVKPRQQAEA